MVFVIATGADYNEWFQLSFCFIISWEITIEFPRDNKRVNQMEGVFIQWKINTKMSWNCYWQKWFSDH